MDIIKDYIESKVVNCLKITK